MSIVQLHQHQDGAALRASRLHRAFADPLLWTLQGWLAMFFFAAGYAKVAEPGDILTHLLGRPARVPPTLVTVIGWSEIVLAALLLAPLASERSGRTPMLAAAGLLAAAALTMAVVHGSRAEISHAVTNVVLLALALGVLWGRLRWRPARPLA